VSAYASVGVQKYLHLQLGEDSLRIMHVQEERDFLLTAQTVAKEVHSFRSCSALFILKGEGLGFRIYMLSLHAVESPQFKFLKLSRNFHETRKKHYAIE
jgi:hypothetical protein